VNWLINFPLAPSLPTRRPALLPDLKGKRDGWRALALGISFAAHAAVYFSVDFDGTAEERASNATTTHKVMTVRFIPEQSSGNVKQEKDAGPLDRGAAAELEHAMDSLPPAQMRNETAALFSLPAPQRPHYFPASQLTQKPVVLQDIPANLTIDLPDAPAQAAVLRLLINELGEIDKVIVDESSVPESAAQAITEAFRSIRFRPGEKEGAPVKSQLKIQIMLESMVEPPSAAAGLR
jgi:hypothetical protein